MSLFFYNLLLFCLSPVVAIYYLIRMASGKEDRERWWERWGIYDLGIASDRRTPRFWVHAVSVGEVIAATPVLRELRSRHPDALIVLSVTTVGGREVAQSRIPLADAVVYFPLDFPFAVARAVAAIRPTALILMEWEIWPNLLATAKRSGATVAVVNGRISDRGLKRGTAATALLQDGLDAVDLFAMQSSEDARRAPLVGADPGRVITAGNTKFDESATLVDDNRRAALRHDFGIPQGAPVWICGSTRDAPDKSDPDEEVAIARAAALLRDQYGHRDLFLVVAPRHIERAVAAMKPLVEQGFVIRRRSEGAASAGDANGLLLDTFGELADAYSVADVAFVGGSLVRQGGQSVFQPLAQGVPALFGPHMNNQRDIAALAQSEGVGFIVTDAESLAETVHRLLAQSPEEKAALSSRARGLIERNRGITARSVDAVEQAMLRNAGSRR